MKLSNIFAQLIAYDFFKNSYELLSIFMTVSLVFIAIAGIILGYSFLYNRLHALSFYGINRYNTTNDPDTPLCIVATLPLAHTKVYIIQSYGRDKIILAENNLMLIWLGIMKEDGMILLNHDDTSTNLPAPMIHKNRNLKESVAIAMNLTKNKPVDVDTK